MLAQQRQAAILDRVRVAGGVRVTELAAEYGLSDMTIRRDLESPADRGLLSTVHGVPLRRADVLITDDAPDGTGRAVLAEQVKELIVVGAP